MKIVFKNNMMVSKLLVFFKKLITIEKVLILIKFEVTLC
jgi:hypothetical protein